MIRVPKSAVLSTQNSGIATLLEDADIEGYIALTLACMFERSRGSQSAWAQYLALLNNRRPLMANNIPLDAYELLKRSEAFGDIETDLVSAHTTFMRSLCSLSVFFFFFILHTRPNMGKM